MTRTIEEIHGKCGESAFYSYSTSSLFQYRAKNLKWNMNLVTYLGIVCPILVGITFTTFGVNSMLTFFAVPICGVLGIIQVLICAWGAINNWFDMYTTACDSVIENMELYEEYTNLQNNHDLTDAQQKMQVLESRSNRQSCIDGRMLPSDKEKRYGQRAALLHFRKVCVVCETVPDSMKATACCSCGNF